MNAPDVATLKGKRDRAVLSTLIGCGLRRSEVSAMTFGHIQQRDSRWVLADLVGKGNRLRTARAAAAEHHELVVRYGERIGVPKLAPHDLRRTFAKLAHKGRAALEQIQLSLGHVSITTTERYLGVRQDIEDAPCDHLGLRLPCRCRPGG